jgi:hypothetical protein
MGKKLLKILLMIFVFLGFGFSKNQILAQTEKVSQIFDPSFEESQLPKEPKILGQVEGTGKFFEIKDSEYLNVKLESGEEITVILESIPRMISIDISSSTASFTQLTLLGLEPNKTYFKYQDSYKNGAVFVSNENGSYSWQQELTEPHHIWFQEKKGNNIYS